MFGHVCRRPDCPMPLYQSLLGRYFVGTCRAEFGDGKRAWAGLFNPPHSGVLLFANVFTVGNASEAPFSFQIWLDAEAPGDPVPTETQSPSNIAIRPLPRPRVEFLYAENVDGDPAEGTMIFGRRCPAETTVVSEEDGKFIIPPGGNFLVNCLPPETGAGEFPVQIAFGWWEVPCD